MSSSHARFTRTLVVVAAGALLLLVSTGAGAAAYLAVSAVFVVAIIQHGLLAASATRRTREIIGREDPDAPSEPGEVAAAVRARVAAERSSAERQNADLRAALEATSVGVVVADRGGRILNTVGSLTGLVQVGEDARVRLPPLLRMFEAVLDSGRAQTQTLPMGPRSAVKQWVVVRLDESVVGAVVTDVTEVHRVQAMRTSFVTDASHELKTPVAAIRASAEALQLAIERGDGRAIDFAHHVEEQAVRLGQIVNDLLDLSRLEGESPVLEPLELRDLVEREVAAVRGEARDAGIGIDEDLEQVRVLGSDQDVGLAIRNLLVNAVRYSPEGGAIVVTLRSGPSWAIVSVEDSGIGIELADQDRVFERFFRADGARSRSTGGTGLGLSIVRHVMTQHGGTAAVESTPGRGSTFTLRFPVDRGASPGRPTAVDPIRQESASTNH